MVTVRRLPHTAIPVEGEAFSSWVDRSAEGLDLQRRDLWLRLGLTTSMQKQPVAYGVDVSDEQRQALAEATGFTTPTVNDLLLRRYEPEVVPWPELDLSDPAAVRVWARKAYVFVWPSLACPRCVAASDGVWQVAWKLPWTFVCSKHSAYLIANCHDCGTRLQSNTLDRRQRWLCCASAFDPTRARHDGRERSRRHADDICGASVGHAPQHEAHRQALALQLRINHLIAPSLARPAGASTTLYELRRLMTYALYLGVPALLDDADDPVRERFASHVADRDVALPRRGNGAGRGAGDRQYSLAIADPLLVAGAMHIAARLVFAEDLDSEWKAVADAILRDLPGGSAQWYQLGKFWQPPERHQAPAGRARDQRVFLVPSLDGRRARRSATAVAHGRDARHVPALLWPGAYAYVAEDLIVEGSVISGRRFAALALARHLQPALSSWHAATEWFGIDPGLAANPHRLLGRLRRAGAGREFQQRLDNVVAALQALPEPIDYASRRRALSSLTLIPAREWSRICTRSGVNANQSYWLDRRPQAAAWLWQLLTGGDWHHAPALRLSELDAARRGVVSNGYVSYFLAKHLPKVEPALTEYAVTLLDKHNLMGPLTLDIHPRIEGSA